MNCYKIAKFVSVGKINIQDRTGKVEKPKVSGSKLSGDKKSLGDSFDPN